MPGESIKNDAKAMEEFKSELEKSLQRILAHNMEIRNNLNQLGQQWQDSYFENFSQKLRSTDREIQNFEEGAKRIVLSLNERIEKISNLDRSFISLE